MWTEERGNTYTLSLGKNDLIVEVFWDGVHGNGFIVRCGRAKLKKKFRELSVAKEAGIGLAKRVVKRISEDLENAIDSN